MSYQIWKDMEGILNAYYWVKDAKLKRLLYDSNYLTFWIRQNYGDKILVISSDYAGERDEFVENRGFKKHFFNIFIGV